MKPSNETLMAYADGELGAADRAAVEAAMAADPQVAQQVETYRAQRDRLRSAFGGVLEEPVPDRLIVAARTAPAVRTNNVTNLADVHAAHRREKAQRHWSWPEWTAIAASLIAGAFLSQALMRTSGDSIVAQEGGLTAGGTLDKALSNQLASESTDGKAVQVVLSYRDKSGNYCRTFVMQNSAIAGAACRENNAWRIDVLAKNGASSPGSGNYRMAGAALPQSVLQTIDAQIEGEPLDATAEKTARQNGWR